MASQSPSSSPSSPKPQSISPEPDSQSQLVKPIMLAIPVQEAQKKPQAVQWTPEETANLIQAYQEKWYSLKKGQLKAHQWEEVTVTVAARCGYDEPTKTSTQCRHKMEKLRKRYRAEKRKSSSSSSAWPFFELMDRMECGPQPISARPVNMVRFPNSVTKAPESDEDYDYDNPKSHHSRSRSINNLLRVDRFPASSRYQRTPASSLSSIRIRKREELISESDDDVEEEEEEEFEPEEKSSKVGEKRLLFGLAAEMKGFAQRIVGVEKKKMAMIRESQKMRMETESKRMKMILDSQSKMIETINNSV